MKISPIHFLQNNSTEHNHYSDNEAAGTTGENSSIALKYWCKLAIESGIAGMKTIAKTIKRNLEGIKGYWKHFKLTSASMEGANNKIGWLNRQAYGYRDSEYFKLKIFDLPNCTTVKSI